MFYPNSVLSLFLLCMCLTSCGNVASRCVYMRAVVCALNRCNPITITKLTSNFKPCIKARKHNALRIASMTTAGRPHSKALYRSGDPSEKHSWVSHVQAWKLCGGPKYAVCTHWLHWIVETRLSFSQSKTQSSSWAGLTSIRIESIPDPDFLPNPDWILIGSGLDRVWNTPSICQSFEALLIFNKFSTNTTSRSHR